MASAPVQPDTPAGPVLRAAARPLQERLERASQACQTAQSTDELFTVVIAQAKAATGAPGGALFTVASDHLALAASDGYPVEAARIRFPVDADTLAGRVVRERRPIWLARPAAEPGSFPSPGTPATRYEMLAAVPAMAGPSALAVLGLSFEQARELTPSEQLLLLVLAEQTAAALDRLHRSPGPGGSGQDRALIDNAARRDTARALRGLLATPGTYVSRVTAMARDLCGAPAAYLTLLDTTPVVVSHVGLPLPEDLPVFAEDAVATVAMQADGPFVVTDAGSDDRVRDLPMVRSGTVGAYLGVPLTVDGSLIGVLGAYDQRSRSWPAEAANALTLLGESVSSQLQAELLTARDAQMTRSRERQLRLLDRLGPADSPHEVAAAVAAAVLEDPDVVTAVLLWSDGESPPQTVQAPAAEPADRAALAALAAAQVSVPGPDLQALDLADLVRVSSADAVRVVALGARSAVRLRLRWPDATAVLLVLPAARADAAGIASSLEMIAPVAAMALDRAASQERHRLAAARAAFLAAAAAQMEESSLDPAATLQRLARIIVPSLADGCLIHLMRSGKLRMAAASHVSAQVERRMQAELPADDELTTLLDAAAGGRPAAGSVPTWLTVRGRLQVIALRARGRVIGSIALIGSGPGGHRRLADPPVLESLAAHAAITIDNALLYAKASADIAALQRGLLPARLPALPGFDLAGYYEPGDRTLDVGGDFYDAVTLADDRVALVIGDVCGSGAGAASMTGLARAVLRTVLEDGASPGQALGRLNRALLDSGDHLRFCTAAVVEVCGDGQGDTQLRVASAGHPPPLLRRGGLVEEIGEAAPFLGVIDIPDVPEHTLTLQPDDMVVMYTDGVTEARHDQEQFEAERLADAVAAAGPAAHAVLAAVVSAVTRFRNRGSDDIALLALRVRGQLMTRIEIPDIRDEAARQACADQLERRLPETSAAVRQDLAGKVKAALAEIGSFSAGPASLDVTALPGSWRAELSQPARPRSASRAGDSQMWNGSRTLVVLEVALPGE